MTSYVPLSEAKAKLSSIVREADSEDVLLMRHGRPAAVVVGVARYDALLEELEDLKDRLSVYERENVTIEFDKLMADLGMGVSPES